MKQCTRCNVWLKEEYFSKDRSRVDGYSKWCKSCASVNTKEWVSTHRSRVNELARQSYYRKVAKNRAVINQHNRDYYHRNKDRICSKAKDKYSSNVGYRNRKRKLSKDYNNTSKGIYTGLLSNSHRRGVALDINRQEFVLWLDSIAKVCHYCGKELTRGNTLDALTVDRKDSQRCYTLDNIVLSCRMCNTAKGSWFSEGEMLEIATTYLKRKVLG